MRRGTEWTTQVPVELRVTLQPPPPEAATAHARDVLRQDAARAGTQPDNDDLSNGLQNRSYVGGQSLFWQPWSVDLESGWRFFFQLDGAEGWDGDPCALNFGGGTGYAFLSQDEREGRFFWDCV